MLARVAGELRVRINDAEPAVRPKIARRVFGCRGRASSQPVLKNEPKRSAA